MNTPPFTLAQAQKQAGLKAWAHRQFISKTPPISPQDKAAVAGKTVIVTGSNTGLGLETAKQLLDLGIKRLILAVRDTSKGEKARQQLLAAHSHPDNCSIQVWELDLLSYDSILQFTKRAETLDQLDIAVLNAGLYRELEHFYPATGYEEVFQVNYLSTFLLGTLLLPILESKSKGDQPGRLAIVSSDTASWAKFAERTEQPIFPFYKTKTSDWNHSERYATSKLLGQLYTSKLIEKVPSSAVTIVLVNPGLTYGTDFTRDGNGRLLGLVYKTGFRLLGKAPEAGALAIVHAAVSFGQEAHGQYTEDGVIRPQAALLYTPEGRELANRVFDETVANLSFASIEEALRQVINT